MTRDNRPRQVFFEPTPEIFATDAQGAFNYPLIAGGEAPQATEAFDEMRLILSLWHPAGNRSIDFDRAYVEVHANFEGPAGHWFKMAEIEPIVPPYGTDSFDGWILLPIFGLHSAYAVAGTGFEPRARLQLRATAYFVA